MEHIYSRVSTDKQETENQLSRLRELYPRALVHEEVASSKKKRPVLDELLKSLKLGDTLIVAALDRLGRLVSELIPLVEDLQARGINLKSVREGVDYTTASGKFFTQILCAFAEMERNLISERTKAALAAKKKQGVRLGPPPTIPLSTIHEVITLRKQGLTCKQVAAMTGVSATRVSELSRTVEH